MRTIRDGVDITRWETEKLLEGVSMPTVSKQDMPEEQDKSVYEEEPEPKEKPPTGLIPLWIRQEGRLQEIEEAMKRYFRAGKRIPIEWCQEYITIQQQLNERIRINADNNKTENEDDQKETES